MEVELHEISVAQVDPSSFRNTLKLLPIGKKGKQKFVCGDDAGSISCYEMKRGEPQLIFKTPAGGGPVTALALGGLASAGLKRERIFYAQGQKVTGLNKKGKDFFKLASSLTENINHMAVEETRIWTGCQYVFNVYDDGRDVGFFMCNDRINALIVEVLTRDNQFDAILGCQDKVIRVIRDSALQAQVGIEGPVTALCSYVPRLGATPPNRAGTRHIVYGTENGLVGWLTLDGRSDTQGAACLGTKGWLLGNPKKHGAVNAIATLDLPRPDSRAVVVGRDDGQLQVYELQAALAQGTPELLFERNVGESIRSLECGIVNTAGYNEIIMSCYSGRIVSFTTEPLHDKASDDAHGRSLGTIQNENKIKMLKKEIQDLALKVEQERDRYSKATHETVPLSQPFQVISTFSLDADEAAYKIIFEIPTPIDLVCLKSTVRLELLEGAAGEGGSGSSSSAISTVMDPEVARQSGAALMACFRAPDSMVKRMVIKARTTEGEYGDIVATVVAKMVPKSAQTIRLKVKPLSLHQRVNELTPEEEARPRNTLTLTGSFSSSLMHEWISSCLPEVPPRIASAAEETNGAASITLHFRNVFTRSVLSVEYAKGSAAISSDSISSIAIFKEVICREANARRIQISDSCRIREETVPVFLQLLHPHLQRQATIARQVELIDAIKELQMQEAETAKDWLSAEYQQILRDAEALRSEVKKRPRALEYLCGVVTDLYVDLHKFRGIDDVRHDMPKLQRLVMDYQPKALLDFFAPNLTDRLSSTK